MESDENGRVEPMIHTAEAGAVDISAGRQVLLRIPHVLVHSVAKLKEAREYQWQSRVGVCVSAAKLRSL